MAALYSVAGIHRLAQLAGLTEHPPAENQAVQVLCINSLLDRAYGKPTPLFGEDGERPSMIVFRWAPAQDTIVDTAPVVDTTADTGADTKADTAATDAAPPLLIRFADGEDVT